jgi:excisionase family DNA binding protein
MPETNTNSSSARACADRARAADTLCEDAMLIQMNEVLRRLEELQTSLVVLVTQPAAKAWYTTGEVAQILGKSDYTVREYCRKGQVRAEKSANGRDWLISHDELMRLRNHGSM